MYREIMTWAGIDKDKTDKRTITGEGTWAPGRVLRNMTAGSCEYTIVATVTITY